MEWGYPMDYLLDLPLTSFTDLILSMDRVRSRHMVEQTWLDLITSQGSGQDVKKALAPRLQRANRDKAERPAAPGLTELVKQRGIRAPRRKKK